MVSKRPPPPVVSNQLRQNNAQGPRSWFDHPMPQLDINKLKATLAARNPGPFHFHEIFGPDWDGLYIGDKVKLGHAFPGSGPINFV